MTTGPIGGAPRPVPPGGEPNKQEQVKALSKTFVKAIDTFIHSMRTIKNSPHLADSKQALMELVTAIKTINNASKEAANFKD